jgi:integrase
MSDEIFKAPKLCLHKATNRAYSNWKGKRHYFGTWNSAESHEAHEKFVDDLRRLHDGSGKWTTSVKRLAIEFLKHAQNYYRKPDGTQTSEYGCHQQALRIVIRLYGNEPASKFGPKKLKAVQQELAENYVRTVANRHLSRIKHVFGWGVANEMVPAEVADGLKYVSGLKRGRSKAQEPEPVLPVSLDVVNKTLPHLPLIIREMVKLQLKTAARPSEIRTLRMCDVDTSGELWLYQPSDHKNSFRGKKRVIQIGPKGQQILSEAAIGKNDDDYAFAPEQRDGKPQGAGEPYTMPAYRRAITRACERAFKMPSELSNRDINIAVKKAPADQQSKLKAELLKQAAEWREEHCWSPNQLRHTAATEITKYFDLDASRTVLGHSEKSTTEIYSERDLSKAGEVMLAIG